MEVPDWVYDEVVIGGSRTETVLALFIYRHGHPDASTGARRNFCRGSMTELARRIGVDRKTLIGAVHSLQEKGFLTVHKRVKHHAGSSISMPFDRPAIGGITPPTSEDIGVFSPPTSDSAVGKDGGITPPIAEPKSPHMMMMRETPSLSDLSFSSSSSSRAGPVASRHQLEAQLAQIGVTDPADLLQRFPSDRIATALEILTRSKGVVRKPAAFVVHLVTAGPRELLPPAQPVVASNEKWESRRLAGRDLPPHVRAQLFAKGFALRRGDDPADMLRYADELKAWVRDELGLDPLAPPTWETLE